VVLDDPAELAVQTVGDSERSAARKRGILIGRADQADLVRSDASANRASSQRAGFQIHGLAT
jgi:hypothetical protein